MNRNKDKIYQVEIKPKREWNFAAKFYFVCIIIFVLFVAYIQIYRHIHKNEIIENLLDNKSNETIAENEIK